MIRPATVEDIQAIDALGIRARSESQYASISYDRPKFRAVLGEMIDNPSHFSWVSVHEGEVSGALLAASSEIWFSRERMTTDLFFYVSPVARGIQGALLAKEYLRWARGIGASIIALGTSGNFDDKERAGEMYARLGGQDQGRKFAWFKEQSEVAA